MSTDPEEGVSWGELSLIGCAAKEHEGKFSVARAGFNLALNFDAVGLNLQGSAAPMTSLSSFTFEVPFEMPRRRGLFGFLGTVRGLVQRTTGARAQLWVTVGNASRSIDFGYNAAVMEIGDGAGGKAPSKGGVGAGSPAGGTGGSASGGPADTGGTDTPSIPVSTTDVRESLFSIEGWLSDAESGGVALPRPPLVVSVTLLGQRQTQDDSLLVQLDSVDVAAASYDGGMAGAS